MATPSISLVSRRAARAKPRIRASSAAGEKIRTLRSLVAHQKARYAALAPQLDALANQLGALTQRLEDLAAENETWRAKEREQVHQHQAARADAERLATRLEQLHSESTSLAKRRQALDQSIAEQA